MSFFIVFLDMRNVMWVWNWVDMCEWVDLLIGGLYNDIICII